MLNINDVKFNSEGLVPAVAVDDDSGDVLMLAYMNRESLSITLDKKLACFWSRSRKQLWLKGETSGNYLHVREIVADCDRDTLLLYVKPDGPACHLGNTSCFVDDLMPREEKHHEKFTLCGLMELIKGRKSQPLEGSYTSYLFAKGLDKILKKVGEESTEVVIAAKNDKKEAVYEISDLIYHLMVLMAEMGIDIKDIILELASRHIIDKKVKQEKMTQ
ncbi:MAG: bifunctional phosphoribosyl-AMP cyclohydrolase/phosphoribosyl-ATP diphosphatase HisIE [Synergistaceae bacterium]|nr:bifunctional phosphoribosyl-AMP cyclohydrolase/phosphoribosyl-ATP diphosphatase HisIE [Synergistaceae bacterium]